MSDLIDRQAAIEWVENILEADKYYHPHAKSRNVPIDEVVDRLKRVPSSQQWIPCSERLPEEDADYLVTFENGEMRTASKEGITQNYRYGMKMLAWMPLPEPYAERREE